jgi:MFS family permease
MPWTMAPVVVAPLAGLLVGRVGPRVLVAAGQLLLAVALGWISFAIGVDVAFGALVVPLALAGVGMGLTFSPLSATTLSSVPTDSHGVASGTNNTLRELGVAVGVAALASVFTANGDYSSPAAFVDGLTPALFVGAVVVAAGAVLALALPRRA